VRDSGLWGRAEWTARAREMIAAREYRFISPTFNYEEATKRVVKLLGAGLVHRPALHLTALAREDPTIADPIPFLEQLAGLLGLDPEADEAAVLQAVRDMLVKDEDAGKATASARQTPDPARFVPIDTVRAMLAGRNVTLATMSETRATEKVVAALRKGVISPAMKEWATALCRSDEASSDSFVASAVPVFGELSKPVLQRAYASAGAPVTGSPVAEALCAQLGLKPGTLKD
jgi:phage I-like protein